MPVLIIEYNDNHRKGFLDEKARFSLHLYFFSLQLFFCTVAPKKRDEINNKSNALGIAAQQECCNRTEIREIQESSPAVTRTPRTAIMKTIILNFQIKTLYIRKSNKKGGNIPLSIITYPILLR